MSNTLGPSLGLDKHGTFEVDTSITREDAYFGNQASFRSDRWSNLSQIRTQHSDGTFGVKTWKYESGTTYDKSRATNPQFNAGPKWFLIGFGARVFVYRGLPNGTNPNVADYDNIAPFFLNETFPPGWNRRSTPYTTTDFLTDAADIYAHPGTGLPREFGANEGLGNFVPLSLNITIKTPLELGCFLLEEILDETPGFAEGTIVNNINTYEGFVKGVIAPFFTSNGCNFSSYAVPSASAGENNTGSLSAGGPAIVNGVYQPNA